MELSHTIILATIFWVAEKVHVSQFIIFISKYIFVITDKILWTAQIQK